MLTDIEIAALLQAQYDGTPGTFDYADTLSGVSFAIKYKPDCTVVAFEGSHNIPDWISNFEADMRQIPGLGGVEHGFYDGLPDVMTALCRLGLPTVNPIYSIGHSRGAAHAQIFAAMLLQAGYNVITVVFGSPRPGDARLAEILAHAPNRSYRNYHSFDEQDFVCDVPTPFPLGYVHPTGQIIIDVPPPPGDPWLMLARHHLSLYAKGLSV